MARRRCGYRAPRRQLVLHGRHQPDELQRQVGRVRAGHGLRVPSLRRGRVQGMPSHLPSSNVSEDIYTKEPEADGEAPFQNCVIKPPAPVVLQDRHRRLCLGCTRAPLGSLVSPAMLPDVSLASVHMQRTICTCVSEGVWLCQPCGRSIRGADYDYRGFVTLPPSTPFSSCGLG